MFHALHCSSLYHIQGDHYFLNTYEHLHYFFKLCYMWEEIQFHVGVSETSSEIDWFECIHQDRTLDFHIPEQMKTT